MASSPRTLVVLPCRGELYGPSRRREPVRTHCGCSSAYSTMLTKRAHRVERRGCGVFQTPPPADHAVKAKVGPERENLLVARGGYTHPELYDSITTEEVNTRSIFYFFYSTFLQRVPAFLCALFLLRRLFLAIQGLLVLISDPLPE